MNYSILIVDDEPEACNYLRDLLVEIIGIPVDFPAIANNTIHAEQLIKQMSPDVVFLDIDMPNENAFQFLSRIHPVSFEVIFITAYSEFAIKAFRLNAVDYILKPIDTDELRIALERLEERLGLKDLLSRNALSYEDLAKRINKNEAQDHIVLRNGNYLEIVLFKDIVFLEAMRNYSKIVFMKNGVECSIIMSSSIADYESLLPTTSFFRIHRSYIVNKQFIQRLVKEESFFLIMKSDIKLPVGRRRHADLLTFIKTHN